MKKKIADAAFSLSGLSLSVGALGFLSGVVQLFIDTSIQLSVKWSLALGWLSLSIVLVLLKVIYDLHSEKKPAPPFETPIKYLPDQQILVIRRNDNFLNNIVVGCYFQYEEIDSLACLGVVHIVQEKVIQIRIVGGFIGQATAPTSTDSLSRLVVRPVVPIDALNQLPSAGT
ncbi:hypothetical protein [Roseateles noduli]|uniref:hypothetical protein n=1 Tax=Roseateles noduli TaxID=2052484 RepID=UPI003D661B58